MSTCAICLDTLKSPVALPCGHVYCHTCISEAIKATAGPSSPITCCPTCREPVSIVTPNPLLIPPHLRPYVLPPFRRLYLNAPPLDPSSSSSSSTSADEVERITARLHMENAILRQSCHAWRARANAHVAAHVGLSTLARMAQDQARVLRDERDELARKYDALKRKLSDVDRKHEPELEEEPEGDSFRDWPEYHHHPPAELNGAETPAHTDVTHYVTHHYPAEDVSSMAGTEPQRTFKRRRTSSHTPPYLEHLTKPATSTPAIVIPHLACPSDLRHLQTPS
ncbi:hypothetical protein EDB86DRAFT_1990399 [Lactarius hatsudake]|nr:hypothetical protein EDB86DRAFT_1990399 [Lactarius hatsudake]